MLSLNGIAFLEAAYQVILNRDIDIPGQNHYIGKLCTGTSKYEVISALANSAERRERRVVVPGLEKYLMRQRWANMPLIGWIARRLYNLESNDPISRQIRALQMQLAIGGVGTPREVTTYLALDVTEDDDVSAEIIAIYALLKSPV
ncbi:DUF4214 domain-containing protein [Novosphingobium sp. PhB165]|uniref:DUF4214 domain-containing protein n=1 Tax=Novosphingobium sp. PhB165 TaxID=2485105 RepID=UPI00140441E3|nr:DUF4214 domain-containing protein [Novosphingobium sp. PhB165]